MKELINYYESFNQMVLATTLLGNNVDDNWKSDSLKIINFIGRAYSLDENTINKLQDIIINDITKLSLVDDANYNFNLADLNNNYFYDVKAKTILFLQYFYNPKETFWLNYNSKNTYYPEIHFYNMHAASGLGHLNACRQVGILYALGIGVKQDYDEAILRFKQCAYWGDITSIYLLACIYKLMDDQKNYEIYKDLIILAVKYLNAGITVIKDEDVSKEAKEIYSLISSIFQDVVKLHPEKYLIINYSFIEVMLLDSVTINEKHTYINRYVHASWREASNHPRDFQARNLGFFKGVKP